jgi:hypothetical protein
MASNVLIKVDLAIVQSGFWGKTKLRNKFCLIVLLKYRLKTPLPDDLASLDIGKGWRRRGERSDPISVTGWWKNGSVKNRLLSYTF